MTLPKFLLAWSDLNWCWVYRWLRPARDAKWSILRTLGLTLLFGALGALLGFLLGLTLLRQPVGWLPWLLGLLGLCCGICWFGVTSICWNQRAAQLQENLAAQASLPKARFPFFRWCLGFVYFAILGVITPLALLVTVENIRGELAWKRERARLVAAGEKLTFREILGPEIPPEQNAGAAEIFTPFFAYERHPAKRVSVYNGGKISSLPETVWPQSNKLLRIQYALHLPEQYLAKGAENQKTESLTPAVNLENWSVAFRAQEQHPMNWTPPVPPKEIHLPEPGNAARDVLAGLEPAEPVLAEICAAAALPRSQFPIRYDEAFDALLAHLSQLKATQQLLELRCAAHLGAGEVEAAFSDATNALNLAELLREEPLLISQLVRYAQGMIAVSTLWQGLAEHRWSVAQLESFERQLTRIDYLPGLVQAFEGERAGSLLALNRLIGDAQAYRSMSGADGIMLHLQRLAARGVLRQNEIALAKYHTENLGLIQEGMEQLRSEGWSAARHQQAHEALVMTLGRAYSPYRAMAAMLAPALGKATDKAAKTQTTVKLAIAACALERYRLAHGEFPEKLEQLVPAFCASAPLDPMVNQPFKYQRTDEGWFLLYSVGLDGKDDGGVFRFDNKTDKEEKDWPWPVPTRPAKQRLF